MDIDFSSTKPDARILILQIILVSVMSFSMQNMIAMIALFVIMDILCAIFLGLKEAGKNLVTYSLLWVLLYVLNTLNIPVICLFTMAPYGMMFFCTLAGGIIGEVLMSVIGKDKFIGKAIGSSMALLGLAFGEYIPFICMREAYTALYADSSFGTGPILDKVMNAVNVPVMIILLIATVICTFLGCCIGDNIVKKQLKK